MKKSVNKKAQQVPSFEAQVRKADLLDARIEKTNLRIKLISDLLAATQGFLDLNEIHNANKVIVIARRVIIDHIREQVGHEPGGIAYVFEDQ